MNVDQVHLDIRLLLKLVNVNIDIEPTIVIVIATIFLSCTSNGLEVTMQGRSNSIFGILIDHLSNWVGFVTNLSSCSCSINIITITVAILSINVSVEWRLNSLLCQMHSSISSSWWWWCCYDLIRLKHLSFTISISFRISTVDNIGKHIAIFLLLTIFTFFIIIIIIKTLSGITVHEIILTNILLLHKEQVYWLTINLTITDTKGRLGSLTHSSYLTTRRAQQHRCGTERG